MAKREAVECIDQTGDGLLDDLLGRLICDAVSEACLPGRNL
jgi:hypothetical protein